VLLAKEKEFTKAVIAEKSKSSAAIEKEIESLKRVKVETLELAQGVAAAKQHLSSADGMVKGLNEDVNLFRSDLRMLESVLARRERLVEMLKTKLHTVESEIESLHTRRQESTHPLRSPPSYH